MEVDSLEETERNSNCFGSTDNFFLFDNLRINNLSLAGLHPEFKEKIRQAGKNDPIYQKLLKDEDKKGSNKERLIYVGTGRTYIPNNEKLKLEIAESEHDSKFAGHFGRHKRLELITRSFFWPKMDEWIRNYICSCDTCQRNKSSRHAKYRLLQPLDTPYAPWRSISVDFIVALPESEGMNQIMVVVDRFTKMGHFITLRGESTAKDCADAFIKNVWKLHRLPDEIVSDRDTRWTSEFWKNLCEIIGIKRNLSTAFHPQSDGQTKCLNQTLEPYLRTFINYNQNDWNQLLPLAKYAYNNLVTAPKKMSPFYANYGYHGRTNWSKEGEAKNPASELYVHWVESIHKKAKENLEAARDSMGNYYNKKHIEAPIFQVVFASGHAGPRKKSPPRTALRGGAGDLFFFAPPRAPSRAPHFQGPVFAVSGGPFSLPPRKFPVPGPRFLWGTVRGPANCSQFRAGDAYFRRMLSNKHTPDRQGWGIFTIRRLLSTGNADHWRMLVSKNTLDLQS